MIYTSYFSNVKGVLGKKPRIRFCSIAGKTPEWFLDYDKDMGLKSFSCRDLMPKWSWWKEWKEKFGNDPDSEDSKVWYSERYWNTVLKPLDAVKLQRRLLEMSERNDVCLLCYETPEKFCHRHLVAKWFNDNGIECSEI